MVEVIISLDGYGAADGWHGLWDMVEPESWLGEGADDFDIAVDQEGF